MVALGPALETQVRADVMHLSTTIRTVPASVEQWENKLGHAVCAFVRTRNPALNPTHVEFLCAPWVHFFTHSVLHRLEKYGIDLISSVLPGLDISQVEPPKEAPGDTLAFMEFFRTEKYSAYLDQSLTGQMAVFTGRASPHVLPLQSKRSRTTTAFMSCFPRHFRYLMSVLNAGQIRFLDNRFEPVHVAVNEELRLELLESVKNAFQDFSSSVSSWWATRVMECFPKSLLENLASNLSLKLQLPANQNLFSADGWHIIDDWKIYAVAQKIKYGTHWVGAPNAISHGSLAVFWQRTFEMAHMDTYLSWGWNHGRERRSKLLPFYAPHQAGRKQLTTALKGRRQGILMSSAARPQHLLEYPYTPERFQLYLNNQLMLAQGLHTVFDDVVTIRTRPKDLGWDVQTLVSMLKNPAIELEFQAGPFSDRLKKSRLHICDNCSTTIVESFWANHPTLVVLTDDYFQLHPEAVSDYKILADAGVFHTSMESLLAQCKRIHDQLEGWWMSAATQTAVQRFLAQQGRLGGGWLAWRRVLLSPTVRQHSVGMPLPANDMHDEL